MANTAQPTQTELETLATMLHSSHRHMARATDPTTNQVIWPNSTLTEAVDESCTGFYDILNRHARHARVYI